MNAIEFKRYNRLILQYKEHLKEPHPPTWQEVVTNLTSIGNFSLQEIADFIGISETYLETDLNSFFKKQKTTPPEPQQEPREVLGKQKRELTFQDLNPQSLEDFRELIMILGIIKDPTPNQAQTFKEYFESYFIQRGLGMVKEGGTAFNRSTVEKILVSPMIVEKLLKNDEYLEFQTLLEKHKGEVNNLQFFAHFPLEFSDISPLTIKNIRWDNPDLKTIGDGFRYEEEMKGYLSRGVSRDLHFQLVGLITGKRNNKTPKGTTPPARPLSEPTPQRPVPLPMVSVNPPLDPTPPRTTVGDPVKSHKVETTTNHITQIYNSIKFDREDKSFLSLFAQHCKNELQRNPNFNEGHLVASYMMKTYDSWEKMIPPAIPDFELPPKPEKTEAEEPQQESEFEELRVDVPLVSILEDLATLKVLEEAGITSLNDLQIFKGDKISGLGPKRLEILRNAVAYYSLEELRKTSFLVGE